MFASRYTLVKFISIDFASEQLALASCYSIGELKSMTVYD